WKISLSTRPIFPPVSVALDACCGRDSRRHRRAAGVFAIRPCPVLRAIGHLAGRRENQPVPASLVDSHWIVRRPGDWAYRDASARSQRAEKPGGCLFTQGLMLKALREL